MSKLKNQIQIGCSNHTFNLTPLNSNCYLKKQINASFCQNPFPRNTASGCPMSQNIKKHWKCLNGPSFNKDRNYASSGFILTSQQKYYKQSYHRIVAQHEKNMKEYQNEKSQLYIVKPKSKSKYCNVCKTIYDEYLDHINSEKHKIQIKTSKFNKYMQELQMILKSKKYQSHHKNQATQNSTYQTAQGTYGLTNKLSISTSDNSDQEIVNSNPRKLVKKDANLIGTQIIPSPLTLTLYPFSLCFPQLAFSNCQYYNFFNPSRWIYNNYYNYNPQQYRPNVNNQITQTQNNFVVLTEQQ